MSDMQTLFGVSFTREEIEEEKKAIQAMHCNPEPDNDGTDEGAFYQALEALARNYKKISGA